ncbi:transcriptional repressor LexA [Halofilum ochraceum]|uniref:transcriptional repressor LexA n=1 Tax=Halofilum ochraceum TaxID=1611323 RepID=UPI0008DB1FC9|nr:transcriptional repressor LexA [Halofilum ochraceum]
MNDLTPRQQEILDLIRDRIETRGAPPTRAEIARELGFRSANAAESHLRALARKGAIELTRGSSRGIRLAEGAEGGLPLVGRVAAGAPLLAAENLEGRYRVDPAMFHPHADYLLRVRGDSMKDVGILDGDLLAVHQAAEAANGQIVVARVDDEVTVKRLKREGHRVELIAENPDYEPIRVDLRERELVLEGLAVGVVRTTPESG